MMQRQWTATAYILNLPRVLLLYHPKLRKWLPPGGHVEPNELPTEAAKREALEETGLEISLLREEHVWAEQKNATSFERPFMCLLENIPAHRETPPHQHIDFVYLAHPVGGTLLLEEVVAGRLKWFTLEEVLALTVDEEIFEETRQTISYLLGERAPPRHESLCERAR